ncbi:MAG: dienelactone hydrolase family protein [Pyrinomonadaceae bacterium]
MENLQTDRELTAEIKLYYDLLLPENVKTPAPLLIAVHGYGGNKRQMMREARSLAPENFVVAALQGFHQHWRESTAEKGMMPKVGFAWLTNYKSEESVAVHHRVVSDLIQHLIAEGVADQRQIFLLGFSQSCALNFRFAFSNPELLSGVVGISGGIPGDWETSELYQKLNAPVLYVYGDADEFYPLEKFDENANKLKLRAANLESKGYQAKHEITLEMRENVKTWLRNNLGA